MLGIGHTRWATHGMPCDENSHPHLDQSGNLAVVCTEQPGTIIGARRGSPLIIGIGDGENFVASDANAIVAHTRQVVYLNDYDVATITADRFDVQNLGTDTANVQISKLEFNSQDA